MEPPPSLQSLLRRLCVIVVAMGRTSTVFAAALLVLVRKRQGVLRSRFPSAGFALLPIHGRCPPLAAGLALRGILSGSCLAGSAVFVCPHSLRGVPPYIHLGLAKRRPDLRRRMVVGSVWSPTLEDLGHGLVPTVEKL